MDEKRYQSMTFAVSSYQWQNSREQAREEMWKDISKFLQLLTKNGYIAVLYDDDVDIIVIQYEHNEKSDPWGVANPEWITEDELWHIDHFDELMKDGCVTEEDVTEGLDEYK